ncbi:hypothetical protein SAMN04489727_0558 [Amycolatopsis tolypomycina]|uniref:Uncharacterized protein n=1 Tax=Amycolatopsis tolypomycina TaxID=208445 RepID=A0A1H4IEZ5_9PSEU|nr:hypothetical protein SAMN04489727_0558 [Amycolatopsis tolypomycina]
MTWTPRASAPNFGWPCKPEHHDGRLREVTWKRAAVVAVVVLLALGGAAFLPWTADHFGYARPGDGGLPSRIHHAGRDYRGGGPCFGADETALTRVGEVGTLFGASHPVFTTRPVPEPPPLTLVVRDSPGCFVGYALQGGP